MTVDALDRLNLLLKQGLLRWLKWSRPFWIPTKQL